MDASLRLRARIGVYSLLGLVALLLIADRIVAHYFDPRRSAAPNSVILYSAQWRGYCAQIRACLKAQRVPFDERDVEQSFAANLEWWTLRVQGVPATLVGQDLAYGFQTERLTQTLHRAGIDIACW